MLEQAFIALWLILFLFLDTRKIKNWRFDFSIAKTLLKASLPLMVSGMAILVYQQISSVLLKKMCNAESVGHFAVALNFCKIVTFVPLLISRSITPSLINTMKSDIEKYKKRVQLYFDFQLHLIVLLVIAVILLSKYIILSTYGLAYLQSIKLLKYIAIKEIFSGMMVASGAIIIIENQQKWAPIRSLLGSIVCVVFDLILIPVYGAFGAAIANIITLFVSGFLIHLFIKPFNKIFIMQLKSLIASGRFILWLFGKRIKTTVAC